MEVLPFRIAPLPWAPPDSDPQVAMIGSIIAVALPDEAAVRTWLAADPYVTEGVWQDIRVGRWRIGAQPYPAPPDCLRREAA